MIIVFPDSLEVSKIQLVQRYHGHLCILWTFWNFLKTMLNILQPSIFFCSILTTFGSAHLQSKMHKIYLESFWF